MVDIKDAWKVLAAIPPDDSTSALRETLAGLIKEAEVHRANLLVASKAHDLLSEACWSMLGMLGPECDPRAARGHEFVKLAYERMLRVFKTELYNSLVTQGESR